MSTLIINSASATDVDIAPLFKTIPVGVEEEYGWSAVKFCLFEYRLDGGVLEIQLRNPHKASSAVSELFTHLSSARLVEIEKTNTTDEASLAVVSILGGDFGVWSGLQKNPAFSRHLSVFRSVGSFQEREGMSISTIDLRDGETLRHMAEWIKDQSGGRGVLGNQIYRVHCESVYRAALFLSKRV